MSKRKTIFLVLFSICSLLLIAALFFPFMGSTDISDEYVPEDTTSFMPDDGGEPFLIASPSETQLRLDGVYTFHYTLPPDGSAERLLCFLIGSGEVDISVDGETVYSGKLSATSSMIGAPGCSFSLDASETPLDVVAKVRYTDEYSYILSPILTMSRPGLIERWAAALTNSSAIPAGIAGLGFLIIITLFLMSVSMSVPDYSLLFLAFGVLCFCALRLDETGAAFYSSVFYRIQHEVVPYAAIAFILTYVIWNRKKKIMKYFLLFTGAICVLLIAGIFLQSISVYVPESIRQLSMIAGFFSEGQFNSMFHLLSNYLVIACVLASLVYHVRNMMEIASEKIMLENNARVIMAGYDRMVESTKATMAVRHEWKHDLLTLSLLYRQGKVSEIGDYLQEKNKFIEENELESLTGCFVLDVILNSVSARARSEGIDLKTSVSVPSDLHIKEEALCQLLLNMFDNAFNACILAENDRFIDFSIGLKEEYLAIRCSNSVSPSSSAAPSDIRHGYGIRNMKKICENYGSELVIDTQTAGVFTVKTALHLGSAEGR